MRSLPPPRSDGALAFIVALLLWTVPFNLVLVPALLLAACGRTRGIGGVGSGR